MLIASELWLRRLDSEAWDNRPSRNTVSPIKIAASVHAPSLDANVSYGMKKDVIAVAHKTGGATIIDISTGKIGRLRADTVQVLRALEAGGTLAEAYKILASTYSGVAKDILERNAATCVTDLIEQGVLAEGEAIYKLVEDTTDPTIVPATQMVQESDHTPNVRARDYVAALGGLVVGYGLQRGQSFQKQMERLANIRSKLTTQPASVEDATRLLAATRRLSQLHLGRAACLELSVATVLAAAFRRRELNLTLGVRSDPEGFHAWPQAGNTPIRTDADEAIAGIYQPIVKF